MRAQRDPRPATLREGGDVVRDALLSQSFAPFPFLKEEAAPISWELCVQDRGTFTGLLLFFFFYYLELKVHTEVSGLLSSVCEVNTQQHTGDSRSHRGKPSHHLLNNYTCLVVQWKAFIRNQYICGCCHKTYVWLAKQPLSPRLFFAFMRFEQLQWDSCPPGGPLIFGENVLQILCKLNADKTFQTDFMFILDIRLELWLVLAQPGMLLAAEQAQLKPPPVPPHSTTGGAVNHAGCLAEFVDHRTMVN